MSIELKIKAKHLAVEPMIIRQEEKKLCGRIRATDDEQDKKKLERTLSSLVYHRKHDVRNEARATNLARAYIKGTPYKEVELKRKKENEAVFWSAIFRRVHDMVKKYHDYRVTDVDIKNWIGE